MKQRTELVASLRDDPDLFDFNGAEAHWPIVHRHEHRQAGTGTALDVFVCGNLTIDIPIELDVTTGALAAALTNRDEKVRCDWSFWEVTVGGFAGHAARAVHALGHRVFLSTVVPLPFHSQFADFFLEVNADTSHVAVFPGEVPAAIQLQCMDGHILIPRPGIQGAAPPRIPVDILDRFDCVLMNPGDQPGRVTLLEALRLKVAHIRRATVAVCGKSNWGPDDFELVKNVGAWVLFNEVEAVAAARRVAPLDGTATAEEAARTLKARLGSSRLVVSLGSKGAFLLNGSFQHIRTKPIPNGRAVGAGDTMLSICSIQSALKVKDEEALMAGVDAATRKVAGLPVA